MLVRSATAEDLPAINDIYNHYVRETHVTFDVVEGQRDIEWLSHYADSGRHRVFVAVDGDHVLGFTTSSRWRPKAAYDTSVETSVYCDPKHVGEGIGKALYSALFAALENEDVHRAYAGIALPNDASIALHERFGFKQVALFTEQGHKFGRYWDVAWFEKQLD
jgi:phosphinothricin acetyltransferase